MYTIKIKNNLQVFWYFTGFWFRDLCCEVQISPSIKDALIFESRKDVTKFLSRNASILLKYDILIEKFQNERS